MTCRGSWRRRNSQSGVLEAADSPWDLLAVGLCAIRCGDGVSLLVRDSKASSPHRTIRSIRGELVEINGGRNGDLRASPGQAGLFEVLAVDFPNSSKRNHVEVVASHELDISNIPSSRSISRPSDWTRLSCSERITRPGCQWGNCSIDSRERDGCKRKCNRCKHFDGRVYVGKNKM